MGLISHTAPHHLLQQQPDLHQQPPHAHATSRQLPAAVSSAWAQPHLQAPVMQSQLPHQQHAQASSPRQAYAASLQPPSVQKLQAGTHRLQPAAAPLQEDGLSQLLSASDTSYPSSSQQLRLTAQQLAAAQHLTASQRLHQASRQLHQASQQSLAAAQQAPPPHLQESMWELEDALKLQAALQRRHAVLQPAVLQRPATAVAPLPPVQPHVEDWNPALWQHQIDVQMPDDLSSHVSADSTY